MRGGAGADVHQGGAGYDLIRVRVRDSAADTGDRGKDEDTLVADTADALTGCERVDLSAPSVDPAVPALALGRATLRRRARRFRVT